MRFFFLCRFASTLLICNYLVSLLFLLLWYNSMSCLAGIITLLQIVYFLFLCKIVIWLPLLMVLSMFISCIAFFEFQNILYLCIYFALSFQTTQLFHSLEYNCSLKFPSMFKDIKIIPLRFTWVLFGITSSLLLVWLGNLELITAALHPLLKVQGFGATASP